MRIVLLGAPGVGKGTLTQKLSDSLKLPSLAVGDALREAVANGSELGQEIAGILQSGHLVPDALVSSLVAAKLQAAEFDNGWILDGFPRTISQAESLAKFSPPDAVLSLEVEEKILIERLSGRRVCSACGASFHLKFAVPQQPNVCDFCSGGLQQRDDDNPDVVLQRLRTYQQHTHPLIDYYQRAALLMTIDARVAPAAVLATALKALDNTSAGKR